MAYFNAGMLSASVGNITKAADLILKEMGRPTLDTSELEKSHKFFTNLVANVDGQIGEKDAKKLRKK